MYSTRAKDFNINNSITILELVETIRNTLERDERIKSCHTFQAGKALQIQLFSEDCFNLNIVKLDEQAYRIKRNF